MTNQTDVKIHSIFPIPVYVATSDSDLISKEEIEKIIQKGMYKNDGNSYTKNTYVFNENLKEIKEFCEHHIKTYVKEVINHKEELDIYITQSWINVNKPGEFHHNHFHTNSIISGVFYVSTEEDDRIIFEHPNIRLKQLIKFEPKEFNLWNSSNWFFPSITNELILFPSWLGHQVEVNEKATTDRISISFNTFVRGTLGSRKKLTELILK